MGRFKSVGYKKRRLRKYIFLFVIILLIIYIAFKIKNKLDSSLFESVVNVSMGLKFIKKEDESTELVIAEETEDAKPLVYIYNTHQTEKYKYDKLQSYNIDYTVMFASYMLEEYLRKLNIESLVEMESISKTLSENNLAYSQSYKASRILMEKAYAKNPSLKYFIDLHRDSSVYDKTTTTIDDKKYVKFLFVVGLEHENFQKNLDIAQNLNNKIININKDLSRGIYKKSGPGVNGIYNQDFHPNTILIEVGGQYNFIDEVNNSLKILASVLYEYIMEDQ